MTFIKTKYHVFINKQYIAKSFHKIKLCSKYRIIVEYILKINCLNTFNRLFYRLTIFIQFE